MDKIIQEISNLVKAIKKGLDCEEIRNEFTQLNVRKTELEEILAMSPELILTKEMISAKLKKDAQYLQDGDIRCLIKLYIKKYTPTAMRLSSLGA